MEELFVAGKVGDDKSADDEGDAEELPHVEGHVGFEVDLVVLDKLDEEADTKECHKPPAEDRAALEVAFLSEVVPEADDKDDEVAEALVDLCGVLGDGFAASFEDKAPGKVGGAAIDFAVEEVAQADEGTAEGHDDDQAVENPPDVHLIATPVEPESQQDAKGGAVAGKTLESRELAVLEGPENLDPVFRGEVLVGVVEEAVAEAGTNEGGEEHVDDQALEIVGIHPFVLEHAPHDVVAQCESEEEAQRIVAEAEGPDVKHHRIHVPVYETT